MSFSPSCRDQFLINRFTVSLNEKPPNSQSPLCRPVLLYGLFESSDSVLFRLRDGERGGENEAFVGELAGEPVL